MKKVTVLLLSLILLISLLGGCGGKKNDDKGGQPTKTPTQAPASDDGKSDDGKTGGEASVKTGLGIVGSLSSSANAGEKDGLAQVDATVAAVLVGQDGKIVDCVIDAAQTKINFSTEGKILTDKAAQIKTKQELKEDYKMKGNSGIGKEWYEQANAFAEYVVGKTVDEVKGIALNQGVPADADITSSVTIHVTDFIGAIEKAVKNAQDLGAKTGDKLGLGIATSISDSKDAAADAEGLAQAYTHYAAVTLDSNGKISSCAVDASQGKVNFSVSGVISTDVSAGFKTKQELKEDYGMKARSGLGKEWYEQANSFAEYVKGKTIDEVKGISLSEGAPAAGTDLASSVTIHVTDLISVVDKAVANAK
jgi:hypothetical protein